MAILSLIYLLFKSLDVEFWCTNLIWSDQDLTRQHQKIIYGHSFLSHINYLPKNIVCVIIITSTLFTLDAYGCYYLCPHNDMIGVIEITLFIVTAQYI